MRILGFCLFLFAFFSSLAASSAEVKFVYDLKILRDIKNNKRPFTTGYSPEKKRQRIVSLTSPLKPAVTKITIDNIEYITIRGKDTTFDRGNWLFVDPMLASAWVGFRANMNGWERLVEQFIDEENDLSDMKQFFLNVISFIHENLENNKNLLVYKSGDELVCRHFSTFFLPLVSKLLKHESIPFWGSVKQISGETVDQTWAQIDEGHIWNLVSLNDGNESTHWFVDVLNCNFVNLSESDVLEELTLYGIDANAELIESPLRQFKTIQERVRLTKEKFEIGIGLTPTLYQNPAAYAEASRRHHAHYYVPTRARQRLIF